MWDNIIDVFFESLDFLLIDSIFSQVLDKLDKGFCLDPLG